MFDHYLKPNLLVIEHQRGKDHKKENKFNFITFERAGLGLLSLQEFYIFLLHFTQRFHGLSVFGPQVLEQG